MRAVIRIRILAIVLVPVLVLLALLLVLLLLPLLLLLLLLLLLKLLSKKHVEKKKKKLRRSLRRPLGKEDHWGPPGPQKTSIFNMSNFQQKKRKFKKMFRFFLKSNLNQSNIYQNLLLLPLRLLLLDLEIKGLMAARTRSS